MTAGAADRAGDGGVPRRLFHYNAGFLRDRRLRRILALAGHELRIGWPSPGDGVAVWGRSPIAWRGEAVARRAGVPLVRIEDAFIRSVRPGRQGGQRLGLILDDTGVHFDASGPSRLERLIARGRQGPDLIDRAREGIARLRASDLSKYNVHRAGPLPTPGYVLIVDQVAGDASLAWSGAGPAAFERMLGIARAENPGARLLVKSHPETALGLRRGACPPVPGVDVVTAPLSPWHLIEGASAIYTVSSQMGFEAILMGRRPVVLGWPFYAGWGLSDDRLARQPRGVATAERLFAAAMIEAPLWYDPCRDRLCRFEEAVDQIEAETRAWREDARGHVALGMRPWKRRRLQDVFGREVRVRFARDAQAATSLAAASGSDLLVWAGREPEGLARLAAEGDASIVGSGPGDLQSLGGGLAPGGTAGPPAAADLQRRAERGAAGASPTGAGAGSGGLDRRGRMGGVGHGTLKRPPADRRANLRRPPVIRRVEDGFLRSRGLGADLVAPLSLCADDLGIHYDPSRPSRLETLIAEGPPPGGVGRAEALVARLIAAGVTKYAPAASAPGLPPDPLRRPRILVPGQVEDDASFRLGAGGVRTNLALLEAARAANPSAFVIYKPHPDVEAGLRAGAVPPEALHALADHVARGADPATLIAAVEEVWTMTSLTGFEALLRGRAVICLGVPFYAGWGLTRDLGDVPERRLALARAARPTLASLAHAALIAYPRYFDPVSGLPCPAEVVAHRLATGSLQRPSGTHRLFVKAQGWLAGQGLFVRGRP